MKITASVSASRSTNRWSTAVATFAPSGENAGGGPVRLYVSEKSARRRRRRRGRDRGDGECQRRHVRASVLVVPSGSVVTTTRPSGGVSPKDASDFGDIIRRCAYRSRRTAGVRATRGGKGTHRETWSFAWRLKVLEAKRCRRNVRARLSSVGRGETGVPTFPTGVFASAQRNSGLRLGRRISSRPAGASFRFDARTSAPAPRVPTP
jgi:hypothetical protein